MNEFIHALINKNLIYSDLASVYASAIKHLNKSSQRKKVNHEG